MKQAVSLCNYWTLRKGRRTMNRISITCMTLLLFFVALAGNARSQSIIADQEQQQRQIDDLKRDVDELKRTVSSLKKIVLKQSNAIPEISKNQTPPQPKRSIDTLPPAEQEKIKAEVCQSVGQFFDQIDRALNMADASEAQSVMNKAIAQLNVELDKYRKNDKLRNVMSLAEALAWDTYVAVENRDSVSGNSDFINYIKDKKDKYKERCRKE
jgi:hypothetical protein